MFKRILKTIRFGWYRTCATIYLEWRSIVTVLFCLVMAVALIHGVRSLYSNTPHVCVVAPGEELRSRMALTAKITEERFTTWIYGRSTRISMDTARLIAKESMKTDKPLLVLAVAAVESEFCPSALSSAGAIGLMQVMWNYWGKSLIEANILKEKRDLYNVTESIKAGNFILNHLLKQTGGNVEKALEKYVGAPDGKYVHKILSNLADLYVLIQ